MKEDQIKQCEILIEKYKEIKCEKARNILFEKLTPFYCIWIKSFFQKKGIYKQEEEILSISWDSFLDGLKKVQNKKNEMELMSFFHQCNYYFLSTETCKEKKKAIKTEPLTLFESLESGENAFFLINEIKKFRDDLHENYQIVFDDALQSYGETKHHPVRQKESGLSLARYQEAKKVFRMIIKFLAKN